MRMIDKIFSQGTWHPKLSHEKYRKYKPLEYGLGDAFSQAQCFVVDNVAEYAFDKRAIRKADNESLNHNDFPNVAPPYPAMWLEAINPKLRFDYPSQSWDNKDDYESISIPAVGFLIVAERTSQIGIGGGYPYWETKAYSFCEDGRSGDITGPHACIDSEIDACGSLLLHKDLGNRLDYPYEVGEWYEYMNFDVYHTDDREWFIAQETIGFLPIFWIAISFLHCKNVRIKSNEPKLTKKQIRRTSGFKGLRYHTLEIEPMKRIIEREGDIEHNGLAKALHICRGHFKDYTKGMGLFGKYKGVYWWPDNVRGKSEAGIVVKDYAVEAKA